MFTFLLAVTAIAVLAYRGTTPAERAQLAQRLDPVVASLRQSVADAEPLRAALRTRTPWLVVTPALIVLNVAVFAGMLFGRGQMSAPETLLSWGAVQGSRFVEYEWWRLTTALFLHTNLFQLLLTIVCLVQVGALLERLVGPVTVASVYLTAGALGLAVSTSLDVQGVHTGNSAAIFGCYGLLLASSAWLLVRRADMVIPRATYKLLAPGSVLVIVSIIGSDGLTRAASVAGLLAGFAVGVAVAVDARQRRPAMLRVAAATTIVVALVVAVMLPVPGHVNVRRELAGLLVLEEQTSRLYQERLERSGGNPPNIDSKALSQLIADAIVPRLAMANAGMISLRVAPQFQPQVEKALEYLRLRRASWQLRAEGLRTRSMRQLQQADAMEQQSLEALRRLESLVSS